MSGEASLHPFFDAKHLCFPSQRTTMGNEEGGNPSASSPVTPPAPFDGWERSALVTAGIGAFFWIGLAFVQPQHMDPVAFAFLSGPMIVVPLSLALLSAPDRNGNHSYSWRAAVITAPFAIAILPTSWMVEPGLSALIRAMPWVLVCTLVAIHGLLRLLERGLRPWEDLAVDGGAILLFVGGAWLALSRWGWAPFGFEEPVILLTAIHFHFAGLAAPLATGMALRHSVSNKDNSDHRHPKTPSFGILNTWTLVLVLGGIPLTAIGITISQITGLLWVERLAAWALIAGMAGLSVILIQQLFYATSTFSQRFLHLTSATCLVVSMTAAAWFALDGGATSLGENHLSLDDMRRWHGLVNVCFAITALLGFIIIRPTFRGRLSGVALSGVRAGGLTVGIAGAERLLGSPLQSTANAAGLVGDLDDYARADFDPSAVDAELKSFFESTSEFRLLFRANWTPLGRLGAPFWGLFSSFLQQMRFPSAKASGIHVLKSELWPLPSPGSAESWRTDGDSKPRLSVRTYPDGSPMYVAAYSDVRTPSGVMMRTGLPLPGSNLTAMLRVRHPTDEDIARDGQPVGPKGMVITSHAREAPTEDQGLWLHRGRFRYRLPLAEQLVLWPPSRGGAPEGLGLEELNPSPSGWARHTIHLFGINVLNLDYAMQRIPNQEEGANDAS